MTAVDTARMTRAQQAALPVSADVAQALAEQHGVCIRPLAMRRIDTTTGRIDIVPVACGSTRADQCPPCSEKARRLRMAQCREGWHLDAEPITDRATPSENQKALMATRADLLAAYTECKTIGDEITCEQIAESVTELDTELRAAGVRGRLAPLDPPPKPVKRSTRRRQDTPDLPRRPVDKRTVGRVFGGRYRPSTFLTLTLDSYGQVDSQGAAVDPDRYDYRRAARDAIHFPALVDRFWQNTRRCVGWEVQYFGTVEPQKRGAPHFHAAIRGAIPRAELRAITPRPTTKCGGRPMTSSCVHRTSGCRSGTPGPRPSPTPTPVGPCPPSTRPVSDLTEPAHVVRFGAQVHVKGILGGTEEAGRHIGYLTKYLTKSRSGRPPDSTSMPPTPTATTPTGYTPNYRSPRAHHGVAVWLLYGIQPHGARHSMTPGRCKGKAHKPEHLGIAGRRVLVSRKWSNKTLDDHRAERGAFVRQLLQTAGIQPAHGPRDGPYQWERPAPTDPDIPPRPVLLLHAVAERQRWKAEYTAAQLATNHQAHRQPFGNQRSSGLRGDGDGEGRAVVDSGGLSQLPRDPGADALPVASEGHRAEGPSCGPAPAIRPRRRAALVRGSG